MQFSKSIVARVMAVLISKKGEKPQFILNPNQHVLKILTHCAIPPDFSSSFSQLST